MLFGELDMVAANTFSVFNNQFHICTFSAMVLILANLIMQSKHGQIEGTFDDLIENEEEDCLILSLLVVDDR